MKFSTNNIKKILFNKKNKISTKKLLNMLTLSGFEVNNIISKNNDKIFDISIPFNRSDCLSIIGISRELSNIYSLNFNIYKENNIISTLNNYINIVINKNICLYYYGIIINNVSNKIKISNKIKNFLINNEIKIKNNIDDIIKYISLNTGFYIHILDFNSVKSGIFIDFIRENYNKNNLLKEINNNINIPIIYDINKNPILIPNISSCNNNINEYTKDVFIGCGIFNSSIIKINSCNEFIKNNFYKYNKNIDPSLLRYVILYSSKILINSIKGKYNKIIKICNKKNINFIKIYFNKIRKIIGILIRNKTIITILKKIKCILYEINKKYIILISPIYRLDLELEEDFAEEILKIYGINKIKPKNIISSNIYFKKNNNYLINYDLIKKIKTFLIYNKYQEIITYSFVDKNFQSLFYSSDKFIKIKNPISEKKSVMRMSLITGLIQTIIYNKNRKEDYIKIFENGICFENKNNNIYKKNLLSGAILINKNDYIKNNSFKNNIFYEIKNNIENILLFSLNKNEFYFKKEEISFLEKDISLSIIFNENKIGFFGIINNNIFKNIFYNYLIIIFEIDLFFLKEKNILYISNILKLPISTRDISIIINNNINIENIIYNSYIIKNKYITKIELIDYFIGKNIPNNYKSITIRLFIQHINKNLINIEIDKIVRLYINFLKKNFYIKIRKNIL